MKWMIGLLLLILAAIQYDIWLGEGGVGSNIRLHQELSAQLEENKKLRAQNTILFSELDDLKSGQESVEQRARSDMGLIAPGETYYQLIPKEQDSS